MKRLLLTAVLVLLGANADAASLCVKSGGNDATAKASLSYVAGNEAGSTCWATLGRAVWGNVSRSSPNASEAAAAGDTVYIFGGTYDTTVNLGTRNQTAYNTANDGTAGNPLVFRCVGVCTVTGAEVEGVLIGLGDNYVEWRADLSAGYRWVASICGEATSSGTDCPASGVVTSVADYPPIMCGNATGMVLEGWYITGYAPVTWLDNWNGLRLEGCVNSTIRNIRIRDIKYVSASNHNRSCLTIYHSNGNTIEHIDCANAESGLFFKDTSTTSPVLGANIIRYNTFTDITGECMVWSIVTAASTSTGNSIYQNVCDTTEYGIRFIGSSVDGAHDEIIANNIFYNAGVGIGWASNSPIEGIRIHNNIFYTSNPVIGADASVSWPADTVIDVEHNVYYSYATFYSGSDGNRTFASFNSTYTDANAVLPLSITSNPLMADAPNADWRLCTGSGLPVAGCTGASPAAALGVDLLDLDGDLSTSDNIPAGVYVTGSETIGLDLGVGGATVPEAPTIGSASAGNARCVVTFTANGNGGSPITSYTATSSPGSLTGAGSSSPITVTGLTNGQAYTFTVTATNAEGTSSASSASNSCTPVATPAAGGVQIRIRVGG